MTGERPVVFALLPAITAVSMFAWLLNEVRVLELTVVIASLEHRLERLEDFQQ
jgi:hypothetical protein